MSRFTEMAATVGGRSLVDDFLGISFKAALVLLAALLATALLRRASASTRHQVWAAALVSVLALPALTLVLPVWHLPMLPAAAAPAGADGVDLAPPAAPPVEPHARQPHSTFAGDDVAGVMLAEDEVSEGLLAGDEVSEGLLAGDEISEESLADADAAGGLITSRAIAGALLVVWALGAAFFLARLGLSAAAARRLVRGAALVTDEGLLREARAARRDLGIRAEVRVVCSERVSMPLAWGIVRPAVVLPAESTRWSAQRRRVVLLHEMAHLKRRDCQMLLLGRLVNAFHWFNPLAWTATRRLQAERERACDDLVLGSGTRGADYAGHLLEIARSIKAARTPSWAAVAMARPNELEGRLLAILDPQRRRGDATRAVTGIAALAAGMLVLPLAALQPGAIAQEQPIDREEGSVSAPISGGREQTISAPPAEPLPPVVTGSVGQTSAEDREIDAPPGQDEETESGAAQDQQVDARVLQAFMTALGDADAEIRSQAAHALGTIESDQAVAALSEALRNDASAEVRSQAAWALGMIESPDAVAALAAAISDESTDVRSQAAWALGMIESDQAISALATAIADESAGVRSQAAWALGMIESDEGVPALTAALSDEEAHVRSQAAWALGMIESPLAVEGLSRALRSDASAEVRSQAAWALGMIEDEAALEALLDALTDESLEVRKQALWAVAQIAG